MKVWILTIEGYECDDEGHVVGVWQDKPSADTLETLGNICIDEEVCVALQTETHVDDPDIENYVYCLEEHNVE